jgi:tetratricopeptide (TPR) repeat protein
LTNLGTIALRQGNLEVGVRILGKSLQIDPNQALTYYNCGIALQELKHLEDAVTCYDCALALNPHHVEAHTNRGNTLQSLKRFEEAIASFDQAIAINPYFAPAYSNRGLALQDLNRFAEALASFEQALALNPHYAEAYSNRGNALKGLNRLDEAIASYEQAILLKPDLAEAYSNRGLAYQELNRLEEALASYDQAIALNVNYAEANFNRANTLHKLNRPQETAAGFDRAIAANPNFAEAYLNKAFLKLLNGKYAEGWPLFEWRWKIFASAKKYTQPLWLGQTIPPNKTLFIYAEQGLGDVIQFCRYIPLVEKLGWKVILEVPAPLMNTMATLQGKFSLVEQGQIPTFDFDYHCPLMSLPLAFKTCLETIPAQIPYLQANREKSQFWRTKLGSKSKLRVGLVWQGGYRPEQPKTWAVNESRNIKLSLFATFKGLEVDFYSLQKGATAEAELKQLQSIPWDGPFIHDLTECLHDFSDTAALIDNLDLIISVDTSTAHLAAAMGKDVWLLNRFDTCWRWLLGREDSPWYPTIRLFRQTEMGNWQTVVENVRQKLLEKCHTVE